MSWTGSTHNLKQHIEIERERRRRQRRAAPVSVWSPQHRPECDGGAQCACPQVLAYHSTADVLGYGGEAGGGKSDLALGLAGTAHWRSIIFRREFPRLSGLIDRSREIFNAAGQAAGSDSFNEQFHRWKLRDGQQIQFAAMQYEQNKLNFQGRPHDLYVFDEAPEFTETQVRFVIGWNRSTHINTATVKPQRCRTVLTFNPPMNEAGEWIIRFFLPWLACLHPESYQYPNPAKPGELRWYAQADGEDQEHEVDPAGLAWYAELGTRFWQVDSDDILHDGGHQLVPQRGYVKDGKLVTAKSRTFIPASLRDNPILQSTGYAATVNAMPEPYRTLLKGGWGAGKVADPWQVIPTEWVRAAEKRHAVRGKPDVPLQAVGADIARGGKDRMSIAKLYGNYLAPIECHPGAHVTNGPIGAALLLPYAMPGVRLSVDVISIGSSVYDSLVANDVAVEGVNFGAGAGDLRDRSKRLKFKNIRAAAYWKLREALDPDNGDSFALPDDPELREELCAARFEITSQGILLEDKKEIIKRIGRSPDKADALALAYWGIVNVKPPARPAQSSQSIRTW